LRPMRGGIAGDKANLFQTECLLYIECRPQMPEVHRIKRTAEDTNHGLPGKTGRLATAVIREYDRRR
jgi:hypothetical protein